MVLASQPTDAERRRHVAARIASTARVAQLASIPGGLQGLTQPARDALNRTYIEATDALLTPKAAGIAQAARRKARMVYLAGLSADFRRNRKLAPGAGRAGRSPQQLPHNRRYRL